MRLYRCPRRTAGKVKSDYRIFCNLREEREAEELKQRQLEEDFQRRQTEAMIAHWATGA